MNGWKRILKGLRGMVITEDNSIDYDTQYFKNRKPKKVKELERDVQGYREANIGLIRANNKLVQENRALKQVISEREAKELLLKTTERESKNLSITLAMILIVPPVAMILLFFMGL